MPVPRNWMNIGFDASLIAASSFDYKKKKIPLSELISFIESYLFDVHQIIVVSKTVEFPHSKYDDGVYITFDLDMNEYGHHRVHLMFDIAYRFQSLNGLVDVYSNSAYYVRTLGDEQSDLLEFYQTDFYKDAEKRGFVEQNIARSEFNEWRISNKGISSRSDLIRNVLGDGLYFSINNGKLSISHASSFDNSDERIPDPKMMFARRFSQSASVRKQATRAIGDFAVNLYREKSFIYSYKVFLHYFKLLHSSIGKELFDRDQIISESDHELFTIKWDSSAYPLGIYFIEHYRDNRMLQRNDILKLVASLVGGILNKFLNNQEDPEICRILDECKTDVDEIERFIEKYYEDMSAFGWDLSSWTIKV